ncbi:MAG: copper chaperone PCu(A)C [Gammaproteobacteria bacterium]
MRIAMLVLVAALGLAACGPSGPELAVDDAWVRPAPPGARMTAAYLTITNNGAETAVLTGVSSPRFGDVEVHTTEMTDGVARMRHQPRVEIPARGRVTMAPGGLHVMLMQPREAMEAQDSVPLELRFEDGRRLTVDAPVRQSP